MRALGRPLLLDLACHHTCHTLLTKASHEARPESRGKKWTPPHPGRNRGLSPFLHHNDRLHSSNIREAEIWQFLGAELLPLDHLRGIFPLSSCLHSSGHLLTMTTDYPPDLPSALAPCASKTSGEAAWTPVTGF